MASKYYRITTRAEVSYASDYSSPVPDISYSATGTASYVVVSEIVAALTPGSTFDLAPYGTISNVIIHNSDAANSVDVTFRNTPGGATDQKVRIGAGKTVNLGGAITNASDLVLVASVAPCECQIFITGS